MHDYKLFLRDAAVVMNLKRMGAMHQSRISFVRTLLRKMTKEKWRTSISKWDILPEGIGTVVYQLNTPKQVYQLVVFTEKLSDSERSDRVIAEKWDCTFALVKGVVNNDFLKELKASVPLQEVGRNVSKTLVLSRANKSIRVFDHIVDSLAKGIQPNLKLLAEVGYILRTTAVYGNGKFGIADFQALENNEDFRLTFSAQMCAVYLLRNFSIDWVNFLAKEKGGGKAVKLDYKIQRYLGVGNATGLGMSLYLLRHPKIVDTWLYEREKALSKVLSQIIKKKVKNKMVQFLLRAQIHLREVFTINDQQKKNNLQAAKEINSIVEDLNSIDVEKSLWNDFHKLTDNYSYEAQEIIISCLLELYPDLVDQHENNMNVDENFDTISGVDKNTIIDVLEKKYAWAINIDFKKNDNSYWFWYSSEDKEEPRLGIRFKDPGYELALPLNIAEQAQMLYFKLKLSPENQSLVEFLLKFPEYYAITKRVWGMGNCYLGEIQANVIGKELLPMDLLRAKLSMLGATKFDPRSDRWVRVTFFQGSPLLHELHDREWLFPSLPK